MEVWGHNFSTAVSLKEGEKGGLLHCVVSAVECLARSSSRTQVDFRGVGRPPLLLG